MNAEKDLGRRLLELRKRAGLSQRALAARAKLPADSHVGAIERGEIRDPSSTVLAALAEGLGVPVVELAPHLAGPAPTADDDALPERAAAVRRMAGAVSPEAVARVRAMPGARETTELEWCEELLAAERSEQRARRAR